ncbi:hypothetical protein TRFO_38752 [Tritrichomonas foetus]|uniref:Uncharacterized protein n=1 Tax=Tritrichomonas foetus TaxID=1144522 RepID=A0A1J4JBM8_9EUKA|nr:hypothetical protein TRFO_38752 [Tritrichomonas foetus]|eukprot:OHS95059.1 hypothetical protein TRFO_38752 [Tritrichomonas foetus]
MIPNCDLFPSITGTIQMVMNSPECAEMMNNPIIMQQMQPRCQARILQRPVVRAKRSCGSHPIKKNWAPLECQPSNWVEDFFLSDE